MVSREILKQAAATLRRRQFEIGMGHYSDLAQIENVARLRSIEGICRHCDALVVELKGSGRFSTVVLRCLKGGSPRDLYQWTPLGETPKCSYSRLEVY